ncbi:13560_t:CDS:1, partial [Rhizophagus irregularis]
KNPLINLKILELDGSFQDMAWDHIENLSLPYLQILKIDYVGHDESY